MGRAEWVDGDGLGLGDDVDDDVDDDVAGVGAARESATSEGGLKKGREMSICEDGKGREEDGRD